MKKSHFYTTLRLQVILFVCFMLSFFSHSVAESPLNDKKLSINIITHKNGKGLEKDYQILDRELTSLGHTTNYVDIYGNKMPPPADVNLFLETANYSMFETAKKNYFIPNPELCMGDVDRVIRSLDLVLCKTREAERIFSRWNNAQYLGFTSEDCCQSNYKKNYKLALHFSGSGGDQKGTAAVENLWARHANYPSLILIKRKESLLCKNQKNVNQIIGYQPTNNIELYLNIAGLHICPSITEGFGHTIMEGMSTGAVIVTTDAPPMNELINDPRCLVGYDRKEDQHLATCYHVDEAKFDKTLAYLLSLSEEELMIIGKQNRRNYLKAKEEFRKNLAAIFNYDAVFKEQPKKSA